MVSAVPRSAPSRRNCTEVTLRLSEALAVTLTVPESVAPVAGAVSETLGAVVSAATVAAPSIEAGLAFPAASAATTT